MSTRLTDIGGDMAGKGDVIEHPVTGERFTFLETAEDTIPAFGRDRTVS
jgi:hypothetical protein